MAAENDEKNPGQRMSECHQNRRHYASGQCKPCYMVRYRDENKSRLNEYVKNVSSIKTLYGLTPQSYKDLLVKQGGKCAICERPFMPSRRRTTRIDHVHGTKNVRGILCHECNLLVGYLEKHKDNLPKAFAYIWSSERRTE